MKLMNSRLNFLAALVGAFSLLVVAPGAIAQDTNSYNDWDVDGDNMVNADEFSEGFASGDYYNDWDANEDGVLDENEFSEGLYDTWDMNNDDVIDTEEYEYGLNREFGEDYTDFSAWDADGNNEISDEEFGAVYDESGVYDNWDASGDGALDENETNDGIFSWLDGDDDEYLNENEVGAAGDIFNDNM